MLSLRKSGRVLTSEIPRITVVERAATNDRSREGIGRYRGRVVSYQR